MSIVHSMSTPRKWAVVRSSFNLVFPSGDRFHSQVGAVPLHTWASFLPLTIVMQMKEALQRSLRDDMTDQPELLEDPSSCTVECAVLFADASGFTALTERLAERPDGVDSECFDAESANRQAFLALGGLSGCMADISPLPCSACARL